MNTYSAKKADVKRKWYLVDCSEAPLGRLSTTVAGLLTGKGKPMYTPHIDCGDYVVAINSDKLKVTGGKMTKKIYYRHSGYPGNLKSKSLSEMIEHDSRKVVYQSVRGMLPDNKLRDDRLKRLKIYKTHEHANAPQNPTEIVINISKDRE